MNENIRCSEQPKSARDLLSYKADLSGGRGSGNVHNGLQCTQPLNKSRFPRGELSDFPTAMSHRFLLDVDPTYVSIFPSKSLDPRTPAILHDDTHRPKQTRSLSTARDLGRDPPPVSSTTSDLKTDAGRNAFFGPSYEPGVDHDDLISSSSSSLQPNESMFVRGELISHLGYTSSVFRLPPRYTDLNDSLFRIVETA